MKNNVLAHTNIEISELTLGTWVFGGTSWGGGTSEEGCKRVVHRAIDCGIRCIDTAPIYSHGESERIIGKALVGHRHKVVLATKCGLIRNPHGTGVIHSLNQSTILDQLEGSLRRLKTDTIDLYQCHAPDPNMDINEVMMCLLKLKKQGKIRVIGVSNFTKGDVDACLKIGDIAICQDEYSFVKRDIEKDLLPFVKEKGIGVLAYGVLSGGLLTGKYQERPDFGRADCRNFFYQSFQKGCFAKVKDFLNELEQFKHPLNTLALNWVRQQEGISSVIVGCRNEEQLNNNVRSLECPLSKKELDLITDMCKRYFL